MVILPTMEGEEVLEEMIKEAVEEFVYGIEGKERRANNSRKGGWRNKGGHWKRGEGEGEREC